MNQLSRKDIIELAATRAQPAVSFYMPLTTEPDQQDQNRIRLKNLVAAAATVLEERYEWRTTKAATFMAPIQQLTADGRFWVDYNGKGLAIFLTADDYTLYHLPMTFSENVVVSDHFYLKPLLPLLAQNGRFCLLALSLGQVQLYAGTPHEFYEIPLGDDVPHSLEDAMKWDDPEQRLQWHTATSGADDRPAAFHGHGVTSEENKKENILRFFHQLDAAIDPVLAQEDAPLVLAAVDYLIPIYTEANSYHKLHDAHITTDPKALSTTELHDRARQILGPVFKQEQSEAAAAFNNAISAERAATTLAEILPAAHFGQIDRLFVDQDAALYGTYDEANNTVTIDEEATPDNVDLLELAAIQTLLHNGDVFMVAQKDVPKQETAVAILRYPEVATADLA